MNHRSNPLRAENAKPGDELRGRGLALPCLAQVVIHNVVAADRIRVGSQNRTGAQGKEIGALAEV